MMGETAQAIARRTLDLVLASMALGATAVIMGATALLIRCTMGSPVFFCQPRAGLGARPFTLIKFRTMREPTADEHGVAFDGQRLTRLGRFLRRTSIDELPSLIHVVRGEMSLVGPRPLLLSYLPRYSPEQARRHEVKPGITGWAQIHGRNALGWDERLALDVWYVDHRSLWLDLRILAITAVKVIRREGIHHAGADTMHEFMGSSPPAQRPP